MAQRHNFSTACEDAINVQINEELNASYTYQSMGAYFSRSDIALPGFAKYFNKSANEEREHAMKLMNYQHMRGGKVTFQAIKAPEMEWKSPTNALESALELERKVNQLLLNLHKEASDSNDPQMSDFIESEYLEEQVKAMEELAHLITNLKRVSGDGLGLYLFDKEMGEK